MQSLNLSTLEMTNFNIDDVIASEYISCVFHSWTMSKISGFNMSQFCKEIETIILTFENLRYIDKKPETKPKGLNDLITPLSAAPLVAKIEEAVNDGKTTHDIVETIRDYAAENEKSLAVLNDRLTYYAQTASLGSVAVVILHEVLTAMTVVKRFLNRIKDICLKSDSKTKEYFEDSEIWHARLVDVAKSFAPLYRKSLRKEKNICDVCDEINKSIRLISSKKDAAKIDFVVESQGEYNALMSSGELQTILINLLDNAIYWVNYSDNPEKKVLIKVSDVANDKIRITINDSGIGINCEEAEKIFQPGITSKPNGIGMGLVIVTELLSYYDCKIGTVIPGELNGATFVFDIPIEKR